MSTTTGALQMTYPRRKQNWQKEFKQINLIWITIHRRPTDYNSRIKTDLWLMTNLTWVFQPIYTIMAKLTNQFQRTRLITSSPDTLFTWLWTWLPGCRNVSDHQQFFSELPGLTRTITHTNYELLKRQEHSLGYVVMWRLEELQKLFVSFIRRGYDKIKLHNMRRSICWIVLWGYIKG